MCVIIYSELKLAVIVRLTPFKLFTVLQIPVHALQHGPLAQLTGPGLVHEAAIKWAFEDQNNAELIIFHNWGFRLISISFTEMSRRYSDAAADQLSLRMLKTFTSDKWEMKFTLVFYLHFWKMKEISQLVRTRGLDW